MIRSIVRTLAKLFGCIHAPFSRKEITHIDFENFLEAAAPGDIVLSRTRGEFTNLIIPGFWKHAAIVSKDRNSVIEAVGEGVKRTSFFDFLRTKDYVILVSPNRPEDVRLAAAHQAEILCGASYDFEFESGDREFYCSELVNVAYGIVSKPLVDATAKILPSDFSVFAVKVKSVSFANLLS